MPKAHTNKNKKKKRQDVKGTSTESPSPYLQEFHSLPKRLVPSEIKHCLYELEVSDRDREELGCKTRHWVQVLLCFSNALFDRACLECQVTVFCTFRDYFIGLSG